MAVRLGEALVKDSLITREQLKLALERQVIFGGRIGTNIVELGILKEKDLASFLGRFFRLPVVNPSELSAVDGEIIACISRELAEKFKMVPFRKERKRLHIAMQDPPSMALIDELRFTTGFDIMPYVVTELRLLYALEKYYGTERDLRYISTFNKEEEVKPMVSDSKEQMQKVKDQFSSSATREETIGILLNESRKIALRAAIFIFKGEKLTGWKGRGLDVDNIEIEAPPHSVFGEVLSKRNYYRGPLLRIRENETLISIVGGTPQDCIMIPIMIRDKVMGIFYADNGNSSVMDSSLNFINMLVRMASISFEIIIMKKKIMDL